MIEIIGQLVIAIGLLLAFLVYSVAAEYHRLTKINKKGKEK